MSAIILTGERANSIKSFFCFILFFILIKDFKIQKNIILFISLFFLVIFISKQKERFTFLGDYKRLSGNNYNYSEYIKNSLHGSHYITAWKIFKNYPYLGVGNKNFRTLFNTTLITKQGYQFGQKNETISSVLGKNYLTNTLTTTGKLLVKILTVKHVIDSIAE